MERKMTYGHICDPVSKETMDEVLAVYMKAPQLLSMLSCNHEQPFLLLCIHRSKGS